MPGRQDEQDGVEQQLVAIEPRGIRHGACCHSSAEDEIDVAERERRQRLLGLGLDELAAQPGASRASACIAGIASRRAADWNAAIRPRPATLPAAAARSAWASAARSSRALGVLDEHQRRIGQPHPAAGALEQRHAGLALQHRELLGDRRGREAQRLGDRGDRPALVQLAQQPESAQVEHHISNATGYPLSIANCS